MSYGGPERRQWKRVKKPLVLAIHRLADPIEKEWILTTVRDFSIAGISFQVEENFMLDETLILKVTFVRNAPAVECKAKVVRMQSIGDGYHEVGLFFVDQTTADNAWLARAVKMFDEG